MLDMAGFLRRELPLIVCSLAITCGVMPVFLFAGVSFALGQDFAVSPGILGTAASVFFGGSTLAALAGGSLADSWGADKVIAMGLFFASLALTWGALASEWWMLVGMLFISGLANGLIQPATNVVVDAKSRGDRWNALRFGAKQASVPAAGVLAGIAVLIAADIGWRGVFGLAAVLPIVTLVGVRFALAGSDPNMAPLPVGGTGWVPVTLLISIAGAVGAGAANSFTVFFVQSWQHAGGSPPTAGHILATGSILGIVARTLAGLSTSIRGSHPGRIVGRLFVLGGASVAVYAMLGSGVSGLSSTVTVVALGCLWGWTGSILFWVVALMPQATGRASGLVQAAMMFGSTVAPLLFGFGIETFSYAAVLFSVGVMTLVCGIPMLWAPTLNRIASER